jgi:hypothetical protein
MARSQIAEGDDGLQILRKTVNVLNVMSRTAYKGWFPGFEARAWCYQLTAKEKCVTIFCKGLRSISQVGFSPVWLVFF